MFEDEAQGIMGDGGDGEDDGMDGAAGRTPPTMTQTGRNLKQGRARTVDHQR